MVVGFLGSGNMAAGMARGWAAAPDSEAPEQMLFTDSGSGRASELAGEVGGAAIGSNAELAEASDLLILAVKPKHLDLVAPDAQTAPAVLSMLGATPVGTVATAFPRSAAMRLMPNLGVAVRAGVMCFSSAAGTDERIETSVLELLRVLGRVEVIEDGLIDAATSVMGCTPAYLALVAGAIADAGTAAGLEPELAVSLVTDTMAATAELLKDTTPERLMTAVASPGGSTEAGLDVLRDREAGPIFAAAVDASLKRMAG